MMMMMMAMMVTSMYIMFYLSVIISNRILEILLQSNIMVGDCCEKTYFSVDAIAANDRDVITLLTITVKSKILKCRWRGVGIYFHTFCS